MKTNFLAFIFCLCFVTVNAQIGIGTTTPSAELEIETTNTGIPALELNPQSDPTGTADGQLAVIGDKLFYYDDTRGKWLSVEMTSLQYNRDGTSDGEPLRFGGDLRTTDGGPVMPFDGTVVSVTARANSGNLNKTFDVRVKSGASVLSTTPVTLSGGQANSNTLNVDFSAGNYINVFTNAGGAAASQIALVVWVKWRN